MSVVFILDSILKLKFNERKTMDLLNATITSDTFFTSNYTVPETYEFNNMTRNLTPIYMDRNKQAFFLIGMSFVGGMAAGFILHFMYTCLLRYFFGHLWDDEERSEGQVNLSFIGDDFRLPNDEPPDYTTVMAASSVDGELESNSQSRWSFIKWFTFRKYRKFDTPPEEEELPPPSYSSVLASLESDLNNR